MTTIARLRDDHDKLRDIADRLDVHLDADVPPFGSDFPKLRWMLVRELSIHLAVERQVIEHGRGTGQARIDTLDDALEDAFTAHIVTWSGATIVSAWNHYRAETRGLLERLRARMEAEERQVFPQLRVV